MELSRWREGCQSVARGALYRLIDGAQRWLGIGMYQPGELALGARGEAIASVTCSGMGIAAWSQAIVPGWVKST